MNGNLVTQPDAKTAKKPWTDEPAKENARELPLAPREGWLTLIAVIVMVGAVAVAIDDAGWAGLAPLVKDSQTKFLPVAALLSVLLGAWLAKRSIRPLRAHVVGSVAGAAFLLYAVSGSISSTPSIIGRLHDLNLSVSAFVNEVFVQGARSTETSVFLLFMGALVWGLGQFAAFTVFRRHQAAPGVILAGLMILINVSLTIHEEYLHLVVFVLAAMLLVMRLNLFEQAKEWRSRGMREFGDISSSFVRNGAFMVALTIVASLVLAANASSAPLSHAWNNVDDQLLQVGYDVNRLLGGVSGAARGPNILFTPTETIRDFWQSTTEEVFTATVSDGVGRRWRGATYDSFDGRTWSQLDRETTIVNSGDNLLDQSVDAVADPNSTIPITATVTPNDFGGDVFVSPADAVSVDQSAEVLTSGANGPFVDAKLSDGIQQGVPYTVAADVRKPSGDGALTGNLLAIAGTRYPDWVKRYLDIRPGSVSDTVATTAQDIKAHLPLNKRDPYHVAEAVQDYLYSEGGFSYTTDVRGLCDNQNVVDCFLQIRKGYCEYFATTMVMLLRELGIPARYVVGYLPGQQQSDGSWLVQRSAAHAWVEVYFPDHGWLEFDPTPGNTENGQAPTHLPAGPQIIFGTPPPGGAASPPAALATECPEELRRGAPDCGAISPTVTPPAAPPGPSIVLPLAIGGLVLAALIALVALALRRVPSSEPEIVFNSLARLAARLGYGRQPAQTAYEYADRLGRLVPVAAGDLQLIATAKVQATYGRMRPGDSAIAMLATAYRHVRIGLLRLVVRRPHVSLPARPRATKTRGRRPRA